MVLIQKSWPLDSECPLHFSLIQNDSTISGSKEDEQGFINYIFVHLIDGNINIPQPVFCTYVLHVFQLGCLNCRTFRVASVERPMSKCAKIALNVGCIPRQIGVSRAFWDNFGRNTSSNSRPQILAFLFISVAFFFFKRKTRPAWKFLNQNFSIFVDFSNRLGSFFFLGGVCRCCGTVRMLLHFGSFWMTSRAASRSTSFLLHWISVCGSTGHRNVNSSPNMER